MSQFAYKFGFPAPGAPDVATRELSVTTNGVGPDQRTYPGDALLSDEWVFDEGANISVTLVDVDGAGNRSEPSPAFAETVTDTVAPPQPGVLGVAEKRQI